MQNSRRKIEWSELPPELLRPIAEHLKHDPSSYHNFRSVCKNWRRFTSISALLPFSHYPSSPYFYFSSSVFLLRHPSSTTPWLVSAVNIIHGNPRFCHPFLRTTFPNLPNNLDLSQFHTSQLTESFHIATRSDQDCSSALANVDKVLVIPTQSLPSFTDCSLFILSNGQLGGYPFLEMRNKSDWVNVSCRGVNDFDDIVMFNSAVYAVDWEGKLYQLSIYHVIVTRILIGSAVSSEGSFRGRRKRLVVSSFDQELYLIVRDDKEVIKIYKLVRKEGTRLRCSNGKRARHIIHREYKEEVVVTWEWDRVWSFGDIDRVLFLSRVYGFFVDAREFPGCQLRNCIVYTDDAFPFYGFRGWVSCVDIKAEEEIRVFQLGVSNDHNNVQSITSYPNFPTTLWSPPAWILHGHDRNSEEKEKELQLDQELAKVDHPPNSAGIPDEC